MTGEDADSAQGKLEDQGYDPAFDPDRGDADPTKCTLEDQDVTDDAEPGETTTLSVSCEDRTRCPRTPPAPKRPCGRRL